MFVRNVGIIDRVLRVVIGLALIAGYFIWPELAWNWAFWIGMVPLASGLVGWCPLYRSLGWSTRDSDDGGAARA
ncbi:YgaP family membrane protein [Alkalilacustris brevis]|uniref:YgaP family membrane protein n=1 Tax=Alkalilacustris brevis TaxID=2026338 RepID=UPI000E0CCD4F|nr:DUF2892 domain-containing protein [Alkalilacustris brevis]